MRYQLPFDAKTLAIFVAVVETRSMSSAAQKLAMTQSAISQAIKLLEKDLGVTLLDRSVRPLTVTSMGSEVYSQASRWLSEMTALRNQVSTGSTKHLPLLRMGLVDSFASTAGPSLIKSIVHRADKFRVMSGVSPILWNAIKNRELDLAITMPPPEPISGISQLTMLQESYVVALPKHYAKEVKDLKSLVQELSFIRYSGRTPSGSEVEGYLKWLRLQPGHGLEFDSADAVLSMVASGLGWTITTPLCLLQASRHLPDITCVPLPPPIAQRKLVLMTRLGELGKMPEEIAVIVKRILKDESFKAISAAIPWLSDREFNVQTS